MRRIGALRVGGLLVNPSSVALIPYQVSITFPLLRDFCRHGLAPVKSRRSLGAGACPSPVLSPNEYGSSSRPTGHLNTLATLDTGALYAPTSGASRNFR